MLPLRLRLGLEVSEPLTEADWVVEVERDILGVAVEHGLMVKEAELLGHTVAEGLLLGHMLVLGVVLGVRVAALLAVLHTLALLVEVLLTLRDMEAVVELDTVVVLVLVGLALPVMVPQAVMDMVGERLWLREGVEVTLPHRVGL